MEAGLGEPGAEPGAQARPHRSIGRRGGLPSGRAVVGALLVTLAVVGLFASYRRSQDDTGSPYVIVASTVPAGAVITDADLAIRALDLGELAGRTFTTKAAVVGSVAVQTLVPGQLLQEANVLPASPGTDPEADSGSAGFEISFSLDRSRALDGRLVPGEVVDVLATINTSGQSCTTVVAPKARVVRIGRGDGEVLTNRTDFSVTLAIDDADSVLGVAYAVDESDVTIVRSTRAQDVELPGTFCGREALADRTEDEPA